MAFFFGMLLKIVYITQTENKKFFFLFYRNVRSVLCLWYIKTVFTRLIAVKGKALYMVAYRYAQT